jgi:hypothetical protein
MAPLKISVYTAREVPEGDVMKKTAGYEMLSGCVGKNG